MSCAFAILAPVDPGKVADLRAEVSRLDDEARSPFARVPGLHVARLVVVDHLERVRGKPPPQGSLLLLACEMDCDFDEVLDVLVAHAGSELDRVLAHCEDYPGEPGGPAWRQWMCERRIKPGVSVLGYAGATVEEIGDALALRDRVARFAAAAVGVEPQELQRRFRESFPELLEAR